LSDKATAQPVPNTLGRSRSGVIDRQYLARFTLGNAALEQEVLELFSAQLPVYLQQLRQADTSRLWREAAHSIKGSAAAVGAKRLASLARLAEQLDIESPIVKSADQRQKAIAAVSEAAEEACREIAGLFAAPQKTAT
jgi:HPt (histidine-containing phosphotransfer) domain-containing protein